MLAASIIVSASLFHSLTDLGKKLYLYILVPQPVMRIISKSFEVSARKVTQSPATSIYKFKWVVISCLAFLLPEVIRNFYCPGAGIYDLIQVC